MVRPVVTLETAVSARALAAAWRGSGAPPDFARLRAVILDGSYAPQPVVRQAVRKADGGVRVLGIPHPTDRAVQRVVLDGVTPALDGRLDPRVHGSRPGRSVATAIGDLCAQAGRFRAVEVVQADVRALFDEIDHVRLLRIVDSVSADPLWRRLVRGWTAAWGTRPATGIPQGAPLSSLLANLYLGPVDAALASRAFIRYVDDIVVVGERGVTLLGELDGAVRHVGLAIAGHKVHLAVRGWAPPLTVLGVRLEVRRGRLVPVPPAGSPWWRRS